MHSGPQRSESNERFVAFTFAASDIVVETDDAGRIAFATGAFPSRFGRPAATFLGTDVLEMVAPHDRQAARAALLAAVGQGRAPPVAVRLADTGHSMRTLAGLALPGTKPPRLCFTFSPLAGLGASGLAEGLAAYVRKAEMQTVALRRSIKDHKFTMAYQPVSTLDSGKTHHLEALIRPAPHESYANPQEFVLLVETLNLATLLDFEVAEVVCEAALTASAPIAFNVSACSLSDEQFGQRLLTRLRRSPAAQKGRILIEMTETAVMPNQKQVQAIVDELRTLAVPFCIDDFGAGNADVQLLRSLPADYIKLDGSYVRDVATDERSRALANGLVEIASRSGAKVIAEWVETEAQRIALQAMGVTLGQGWLFGKPGPLVSEERRSVARRQGAREQWG